MKHLQMRTAKFNTRKQNCKEYSVINFVLSTLVGSPLICGLRIRDMPLQDFQVVSPLQALFLLRLFGSGSAEI